MKLKSLLFSLLLFTSIIGFSQNRQALPLNESFDTSSLPTGWTLESNTIGWVIKDWAYSAPYALAVPYDSEDKDDWVFTPGLELTAGKTYIIRFMLKTSGLVDNNEDLRVKTGTTASSAWMTDLIWERTGMRTGEYEQITTKYTAPTSNTYYFAWYAFSAANQDYIVIDDVSIYEAPAVDVKVVKSELPEAEVIGDSPNSTVTVLNLGSQTVSFDVELIIKKGSSTVFTETKTVSDLACTEAQQVSFSDYITDTEGTYNYSYTATTTDTDADTNNNTLSQDIEIINGCLHSITLSAPILESGWNGGHISITSDGISVLTNATLPTGVSADISFASSTDADIAVEFDGQGDLTDDCYWEIFDGGGKSILTGNGTGDNTPVSQSTTGRCISTAVEYSDNMTIEIMPNPSTGKFNIISDTNYRLSITDISGKEILNTEIKKGNKTINLTQKGIFFLTFSKQNEHITKKLIIN